MDDLIRRNSLLNKFRELEETEKAVGLYFSVAEDTIKEEPVAYSVSNVVAQLEEQQTSYDNSADKRIYDAYTKVIDTVKQGVVTNAYCNWEYNEPFAYAESECGSLDTHRIDFRKLKYCPYCSRKMKVKIVR